MMFLLNTNNKGIADPFLGVSVLNFFGAAAKPRAYWPLSNGSLYDLTNGGSNATAVNSPYSKGGVCGNRRWGQSVYTFTGSGDTTNYLQVSGSSTASVRNLTACSLSFWTMIGAPPSGAASAFYEELTDSWGTPRFGVYWSTSGTAAGYVRTTSGSSYQSGAYYIMPYMWTHVALTWSSGSTWLRYYLNGRLRETVSTSGTYTDNTTCQMINIGGRKTSGSDNFSTRAIGGYMAEVAIFGSELQPRQIVEYYKYMMTPSKGSTVTKFFPSHAIATTSLRLRASATIPKLYDYRNTKVSQPYAQSYWPMENSNLINLGKNTVGGTANSMTYTACQPLGGGAATFSGANTSYMSCGSGNVSLDRTGFLLSFWIKWDSLTTGEYAAQATNCILGFSSAGVGTFWILQLNNPNAASPNTINAAAYDYTPATWRTNRSNTLPLETGRWFHIALYNDMSNSTNVRWYVNGVNIPGNNNSGGDWTSWSSPSTDFRIGWVSPTSSWTSGFAGAVREVQIINRYVSQKQIADYYNARIGRFNQQIPALYTIKDAIKQRAVQHNRNKTEFLVKGDIRHLL